MKTKEKNLYEVKAEKPGSGIEPFVIRVMQPTPEDAILLTKQFQKSAVRSHFGDHELQMKDLSWSAVELEKSVKPRSKPNWNKIDNAHRELTHLGSRDWVDKKFEEVYG